MLRTLAVSFFALVSLVFGAHAQIVPITLTCSGIISDVDASAYPGVSPGTAYSIEYDLNIDITAPFDADSTQSSWSASGTVTLTIDGLAPITQIGPCPVQLLDNPFADDRDWIRFVFNVPGGGFRSISLITNPGSTLIDIEDAPSAAVINQMPPQSSTFAFVEQDAGSVFLLNGRVTSFTATGGAPPAAPEITTQPVSEIVNLGDVHNFTVGAQGTELSYQWFRDGVALTDGPGVAGSQFSRLVSNPGGSVTSIPAVLAVVNECRADQNNDGTLSPADFTAWIANYNAGCP